VKKSYPFPLPRFNARIDHTHDNVLIVNRNWLALRPATIERILDGREPVAAWVVSDLYGYAMFPVACGGWADARALADQLNRADDTNGAPTMTTPATDPLALERFTVRFNVVTSHVVITDRDSTPVTGKVADRIIGDHKASVIWYTSDRYDDGYIVFPADDRGWAMAATLADQLNDLDAANDAEQADALIDDAATPAEQIEADAAPDLTAAQRRGITAYQRAAVLPPYPYGAGCGEQFTVGDRVRIGDPGDPYYAGALAGVGLYHALLGQTGTVIIPQSPTCPLIVLLDDDEPIALPHPSLYVRRAE
jgi:hypothetical protein